MRIIAYSFEADIHCIACAVKRFGVLPDAVVSLPVTMNLDSNSIPYEAEDSEGNPIRPVFSTDENDFTYCGTCHQEINP